MFRLSGEGLKVSSLSCAWLESTLCMPRPRCCSRDWRDWEPEAVELDGDTVTCAQWVATRVHPACNLKLKQLLACMYLSSDKVLGDRYIFSYYCERDNCNISMAPIIHQESLESPWAPYRPVQTDGDPRRFAGRTETPISVWRWMLRMDPRSPCRSLRLSRARRFTPPQSHPMRTLPALSDVLH